MIKYGEKSSLMKVFAPKVKKSSFPTEIITKARHKLLDPHVKSGNPYHFLPHVS